VARRGRYRLAGADAALLVTALGDRSEMTPADDAHPPGSEVRPRIKSRPSPTTESIVGEISCRRDWTRRAEGNEEGSARFRDHDGNTAKRTQAAKEAAARVGFTEEAFQRNKGGMLWWFMIGVAAVVAAATQR
jgi:hypothetical protein